MEFWKGLLSEEEELVYNLGVESDFVTSFFELFSSEVTSSNLLSSNLSRLESSLSGIHSLPSRNSLEIGVHSTT